MARCLAVLELFVHGPPPQISRDCTRSLDLVKVHLDSNDHQASDLWRHALSIALYTQVKLLTYPPDLSPY